MDKKMVLGLLLLIILGGTFVYMYPPERSTGNAIVETYNTLSPKAKALYYTQSDQLTKAVPQRIVELDELNIGCFGAAAVVAMTPDDKNLGGQCCGALKDVEGYEKQREAINTFIKKHGGGDVIPKDPYDLSVEHAQLLTSFDNNIILTPEQQAIYDVAIKNSHHGGPCCCKCWKWYVMSGLAKKLIVDYNFTNQDISELWDISSSCGHADDTNFQEHYDGRKNNYHN